MIWGFCTIYNTTQYHAVLDQKSWCTWDLLEPLFQFWRHSPECCCHHWDHLGLSSSNRGTSPASHLPSPWCCCHWTAISITAASFHSLSTTTQDIYTCILHGLLRSLRPRLRKVKPVVDTDVPVHDAMPLFVPFSGSCSYLHLAFLVQWQKMHSLYSTVLCH